MKLSAAAAARALTRSAHRSLIAAAPSAGPRRATFFSVARMSTPVPPALNPATEPLPWGDARTDPLQYLRNDDKTLNDYLAAENNAAEAYYKRNRGLLKPFRRDLESFLRVEKIAPSVPDLVDGWQYWNETTHEGIQYWRRHSDAQPTRSYGAASDRELVLDTSVIPGSIKKLGLSPSHGLIGYLVEQPGAEFGTLHFRRLHAPCDSAEFDVVPVGATAALNGLRAFSFEFVSDSIIVYTVCNDQLRPDRVFVGDWRQPANTHTLLLEDDLGFIDLGKTKDKRFVTININTLESSEVHVYPVDGSAATPILVSELEDGVQYFVDHHGDQFFILTNADGAQDFKLVTAPTATPGRAHWSDFHVPAPGDKIEDVDLFAEHVVLYMKRQGESVVEVIDTTATDAEEAAARQMPAVHQVPLPKGGAAVPGINLDYHADTFRMTIQHPFAYDAIVDYNMKSRRVLPRRLQPVPVSAFNAANYDVTRIWVTSRDESARIPVTLLHRRGMELNGSNPVSLRAYGAYGLCIDPTLRLDVLSLVKRGWIVAIAHVRGGSEMGRAWYSDGKLVNKRNSFYDVIDVAEHLCTIGMSRPELMTATGFSAGGLTIAAAAMYRPDLFRALVLHSPFVDVLGSMMDESLPLTQGEFAEWGNPLASKAYYDLMSDYSPYDQVLRHLAATNHQPEPDSEPTTTTTSTLTRLPSLLVTAGKRDQRTPVWQTAKFVALYRHLAESIARKHSSSTCEDVVFSINDDGSHFGDVDAGQVGRVEEMAREVTFLNRQVEDNWRFGGQGPADQGFVGRLISKL
ncbi:hypothetical protein H9P43_001933 [Blastocladiella emersonii ATCC 22665]|nr:hypothetical protein H9P43_001933 [Blastocladiella emersonii ATCC 22665]